MPNGDIALIPALGTTIEALNAVVDGYPEVKHRLDSRLGSEPVETGVEVHDHVVAMPPRLELEGWTSDLREGGFSRPAEAWATILRLHKEAEPLNVFTPWGAYSEMIIESIEAEQMGGGLKFDIKLQQINRITLSGEGIPERFIEARSPASGRSETANLGTLEPPVTNTVVDEWGNLLASRPLDSFAVRDVANLDVELRKNGLRNTGQTIQTILEKAGDIAQSGSISGIAGTLVRDPAVARRIFRGLDEDRIPGLSNAIGNELQTLGFGDLPHGLAEQGQFGQDVGSALGRAGDPRLERRLQLANARRLITRIPSL